MPSVSPHALLRSMAGVAIAFALLCPALWGEALSSSPKLLTSLWQKHLSAQLTGLDLTWDGQTVAITAVPSASDGDSRLLLYDLTGRELWTTTRGPKILSVSLSNDGQFTAIGAMDFSMALFAKHGELLWERKSVGLPYLTPQGKRVVALNSGITDPANPLLEVFQRDGDKVWSLRRKGRVWRSIVSDQMAIPSTANTWHFIAAMARWNGRTISKHRQPRVRRPSLSPIIL